MCTFWIQTSGSLHILATLTPHTWVFPKNNGKKKQIIQDPLKNRLRVFHYFHHPFWGFPHPYFWGNIHIITPTGRPFRSRQQTPNAGPTSLDPDAWTNGAMGKARICGWLVQKSGQPSPVEVGKGSCQVLKKNHPIATLCSSFSGENLAIFCSFAHHDLHQPVVGIPFFYVRFYDHLGWVVWDFSHQQYYQGFYEILRLGDAFKEKIKLKLLVLLGEGEHPK